MKLLFLADFPIDGKITGGVQSAFHSLFEGLIKFSDQHEISVLTLVNDINKYNQVLEKEGIKVYCVESVKSRFLKPRFIFNSFRIFKKIKEINPDVINVIDNPSMAIAGARINCPKIYTIHGIKSIESKIWKGKEYWSHKAEAIVEKYIFKKYQNYISISPYVEEILKGKKVKFDNIFYIPNAISDKYSKYEEKTDSGNNTLTILNIGSFTYLKSQHILLQALSEMDNTVDINCLLCGNVEDEVYFEYLKSFKSKINNLEILSNMSQEDIIRVMSKSSILIHTSKQENTPMIFLEAFARKLPVVSSNVGGVKYILNDEKYGTSYEHGNTNEIKKIIMNFISNDTEFKLKAEKAFEYVNYNHKSITVAEKTINAMISLVK